MAKDEQPGKVGTIQRFKQIGTVVAFTAKGDKKFVPYAVTAAAVPLIALALVLILGHWSLVSTILWVVTMLFAAFAGFLSVLNVRSNNAWIKMAEETPGSSAQVIENIRRGDFRVSPAVSATMAGDMVHLVLGRKGVILVGEGPNPAKVRQMIGQEKRRLAKVIGTAPMSDLIVGHGEGEVPMKKLQRTLSTMPNVVSPKDVNALDVRLKALTARPQMPKGAIPKNMRPQTGAFRAPKGR